MSSFLKDLPCRNPDSFTRFHAPGAIRQTSVRPTYTAKLDSNAQEIINDPVPLLIRRLSRLPKDESRKRSMPDDESEVPSFSVDQSKRCRQNIGNQVTTTTANQQQQHQHQTQRSSSSVIESDAEFS